MNTSSIRHQKGITLIESLIALLVAALGVLGVVGVQMRTLADTQTGLRRAQAIRLIEDLGERMKASPNALANIDSYTSDFDDSGTSTDCESTACNLENLAKHDVYTWKQTVQQQLPLGQAAIFLGSGETNTSNPNRRQLGVMLAWRKNERADADEDYLEFIDAAELGGGGGKTCPTGFTCHLQYISVGARCAPYNPSSGVVGSVNTFHCSGA